MDEITYGWPVLFSFLTEAFESPELSWKSVAQIMASIIRVGKANLQALIVDGTGMDIAEDIVSLCLTLVRVVAR